MNERCFYCFDQNLICEKPTIPLIPGRWKYDSNGQRVGLNPGKIEQCSKRVVRLRDLEQMHQTGQVPRWARRYKSDSF